MNLQSEHMLALFSSQHIIILVIILVILLVLFGGKKLPELAKGLGKGMRVFRDELHGLSKDMQESETKPTEESKAPQEPQEKK